jgi:hypothetical protein
MDDCIYLQTTSRRQLIWMTHHGDLPYRHRIYVTCGNNRCLNINHLVAMTIPEGNARFFPRDRGEDHASAKLTDENIRSIRADTRTQSAIGLDFHVSAATISGIKLGKTWGHVK